jgi:hypothetical protein
VFGGGNLKKKASLEHLDADRRITLKFILNKYDENAWTEEMWFKTFFWGGGGACEYGNEIPSS